MDLNCKALPCSCSSSSTRVCTYAILLFLSVSSACASTPLRPASATAARSLADTHDHDAHTDDSEAAETPFVDLLGTESPIDHILGLYADSGSTEDAVTWFLEATRYAHMPKRWSSWSRLFLVVFRAE